MRHGPLQREGLYPTESLLQNETSFWIDRTALTLLKEETHSQGRLRFGNLESPEGIVDTQTTRTYTVVEINFKPEAETFSFMPPMGATEVACAT
ncbi:MAG TPA: hypothetical protein VNU92_07915 [Edaphobacter sp.]|jgi:hypothetical protein|nr:hypothetical protein [Edaphobacter sp.]